MINFDTYFFDDSFRRNRLDADQVPMTSMQNLHLQKKSLPALAAESRTAPEVAIESGGCKGCFQGRNVAFTLSDTVLPISFLGEIIKKTKIAKTGLRRKNGHQGPKFSRRPGHMSFVHLFSCFDPLWVTCQERQGDSGAFLLANPIVHFVLLWFIRNVLSLKRC